jgi:hypothetical protein
MLLADLRGICATEPDRDSWPSHELVERLCADEEQPWGGWRKGQGLTPHGLARLLKPYGVRPRTRRAGTLTSKGYLTADLAGAWGRYCPESGMIPSVTPSQPRHDKAATEDPNRHDTQGVTVSRGLQPPMYPGDVTMCREEEGVEARETEHWEDIL